MGRNDIKYFNISEYCPGLGLTVSSCTDSQTWAWLCLAVQTVRPGQRLAVSGPARSCRQTRLRRWTVKSSALLCTTQSGQTTFTSLPATASAALTATSRHVLQSADTELSTCQGGEARWGPGEAQQTGVTAEETEMAQWGGRREGLDLPQTGVQALMSLQNCWAADWL